MKKFKFYHNGVRTRYSVNLAKAMLDIAKEYKELRDLKPSEFIKQTNIIEL